MTRFPKAELEEAEGAEEGEEAVVAEEEAAAVEDMDFNVFI